MDERSDCELERGAFRRGDPGESGETPEDGNSGQWQGGPHKRRGVREAAPYDGKFYKGEEPEEL